MLPFQSVQDMADHSNIDTARKHYLSIQNSDQETARGIHTKHD